VNSVAIPLAAPRGGDYLAGSGCLIDFENEKYLLTCAHIAFGQNGITTDWDRWSPLLGVLVDGVLEPIQLFDVTDGTSTPRFRYLAADSRAMDMMAVPLTALPAELASALLREYEVLEISGPERARSEASVSVHGYPVNAPDGSTWAWPPPEQVEQGTVIETIGDGLAFEAWVTTREGYSGGPVLDSDGNLIGMLYGHRETLADPGRCASLLAVVTMLVRSPR
jgi:hypothetical protein